ncbi:hypothetical protein BKA70DRAFT_1296951 [Coprinopsis sp. MPI-PUGE-AT-0042]|nr:hypothetical protein BKA70DRAFT_1296951 [Coprinopsis sp. MPI-PUGE-AT-0042]
MSSELPTPPSQGFCEYADCPDMDSDPEANSRCSVCKYQEYCSQRCQKLDWKRLHKYGCSSLTVDPQRAFLAPDAEELEKMIQWALRWFSAFEKLSKEVTGNRRWKASSMPESKELLDMRIESASTYTRLPKDHMSRPFRLPLVLISRRFSSEMFEPLTEEARKVLGDYLTTCGHNPPGGKFTKVYGPKLMRKPADLAPDEYNFWITFAPIVTGQDYGVCQFKEWQLRCRALATARVFLWEDGN